MAAVYESSPVMFAADQSNVSNNSSSASSLAASIPPDDRPSRSSTFALRRRRSDSAESPLPTSRSQTVLLPPANPSRRSPSPGGRIKDIFRSKKSSSSLSSGVSPERPEIPDLPSGSPGITTTVISASPAPSHPAPVVPSVTVESDSPAAPAQFPPTSWEEFKTPAAARYSRRRLSQTKVDTAAPPRTPPSDGNAAPVIVNTPPTPTDPHHTVEDTSVARPASSRASTSETGSPAQTSPARPASITGAMINHRRLRSGSAGPSKLSNITLPPLSPMPENSPAAPVSNPAAGFFSSVLSAAQNAANTISSSIQSTSIGPGAGRARSATLSSTNGSAAQEEADVEDVVVEPAAVEPPLNANSEKKEPAVKTIGMGDLKLSHLGLAEPASAAPSPAMAKFPDIVEPRARSESSPVEASSSFAHADGRFDDAAFNRPRSLYDAPGSALGSTEERTPPSTGMDEKFGSQRNGSVRSTVTRRRNRGSSAATGGTGTTVAAGIASAIDSAAHPVIGLGGPKLTGFAIASKKRNRDFHNIFKSVPDDDYLIEDYSCALQREILAHGRLYVSEGHLCFSSNIMGWVTTLVLSFDEIVSVEKRSTALIFKNGLIISTLQNRHTFASFTSRDATYDLIINIWKLGHPSLKSYLNGVRLEGTGGDKTEKVIDEPTILEQSAEDQLASDESDDESDADDDEVYDEDVDDGHLDEASDLTAAADASNPTDVDAAGPVSRKVSAAASTMTSQAAEGLKDASSPTDAVDFPGPTTHAPTDCGDEASHYDRVVGDDVVPAPLGKVYNLIFGTPSVQFMSKWLTESQKCTELQMDDKNGLSTDHKSRSYSYIKPLPGSIGPRQTKCNVTENVERIDWAGAVNMTVSTQTPDVPNGNIFTVKTKYCLSWAENNKTRVQVNCTIEWTGKSWLKGPIERGATDGQTQYCKDLFTSLKAAVSSSPRPGGGGTLKARKRGRKARASQSAADAGDSDAATKRPVAQNWGLLEPLRGLLEPLVDVVKPILTGNVMYGLLVGLLVASWFGFGLKAKQVPRPYGPDIGMGGYYYPDRIAVFDEMWRREESELWGWLEERVGLDRLGEGDPPTRKRAMEPRTAEERIREDKMDEREIEDAIRVTEEKLQILKDVVSKRKSDGKPSSPAQQGTSSRQQQSA